MVCVCCGEASQGRAKTRWWWAGPRKVQKKIHTVDADNLTHVCGDDSAREEETAVWKVKQEKCPWKKKDGSSVSWS